MSDGHPVLMTVDDDPTVLRAVERDLRRNYSAKYKIVRAPSGESALDALQQLKLRDEPVALILADQRMPGMTGVELLEKAKELFPDVKSVLLTAYADTDAAIRAINTVRLDYYVLKPWDPPEERLYPVLDDLLGDWEVGYAPPFAGVRLVGSRWSPDAHALRDFLARNRIPYRWLDVESEEGARIVTSAGDDPGLPLVVLDDGRLLSNPAPVDVANAVGLTTTSDTPFFDLLIVGGGPAGLAAAVYSASEGLSTAVIEREAPGGQAGQSSRIENYLGFPQGIAGADLARRAFDQARKFGAEILSPQEVSSLRVGESARVVTLGDGTELSCHALIVASGVAYRRIGVPGSDELTGAGVYYGAAMTEARDCTNEDIYIVGGANSAGQAAMYFSRYARSVTLLVRAAALEKGMSQYLVDQVHSRDSIHVRLRTRVSEVAGDGHLEKLTIENVDTGESETVTATSLFIFIGADPYTEWLHGVVARDERGFILTGADVPEREVRRFAAFDRDPYLLETSVPGVFAVGDVRARSVKRVASAVGEGSIAVQFVHEYLNRSR